MNDRGERAGGTGTGAAEPADRDPGGDADGGTSAGGGIDGESLEPAIRRVAGPGSDPGTATDDEPEPVPEPDGERRTLNPRIRVVWLTRALVGALVATGVSLLVALALLDGALWLPAAVFLLVGGAATWLARARYRRWSYYLRADSLLLDRGVITRVRTVVPYVRIQHVDTRRGPVERALGLASVVVYTAGSRGADVTVPGLTRERAEELQGRLKRIAIHAEGEDAV
jgi:hypothetical protein